jgi:hypothetical protein
MKNLFYFLIISEFLLSGSAFSQEITDQFNKFNWLEGKWERISERSESFEIWEKISDSLFTGTNYSLRNNDTVSYESIRLEILTDGIFYIPTVKGQNEDKPVYFKLISYEVEAIFENKEHDFPQIIIYKQEGDSLKARIEGEINGSFKQIPFNFVRVSSE